MTKSPKLHVQQNPWRGRNRVQSHAPPTPNRRLWTHLTVLFAIAILILPTASGVAARLGVLAGVKNQPQAVSPRSSIRHALPWLAVERLHGEASAG